MFDPFKDFETAGYLRNKFAEKDPQIVQELEHQMFRASLDEAIAPPGRESSILEQTSDRDLARYRCLNLLRDD